MNSINKNPALQNAFNKARDVSGASGFKINNRELGKILKAAGGPDGKVSNDEAREVARLLMTTYSNFTPAAGATAKKFLDGHGFKNINDVFTR